MCVLVLLHKGEGDRRRLPGKSAKNNRRSSAARSLAFSIQGRQASRCRNSGISHGAGDQGDHAACNRSSSGSTSRWWNRPLSEPHTSIRTDMLFRRPGMLSATQPAYCSNMSPCSAHLLLSVHACVGKTRNVRTLRETPPAPSGGDFT